MMDGRSAASCLEENKTPKIPLFFIPFFLFQNSLIPEMQKILRPLGKTIRVLYTFVELGK